MDRNLNGIQPRDSPRGGLSVVFELSIGLSADRHDATSAFTLFSFSLLDDVPQEVDELCAEMTATYDGTDTLNMANFVENMGSESKRMGYCLNGKLSRRQLGAHLHAELGKQRQSAYNVSLDNRMRAVLERVLSGYTDYLKMTSLGGIPRFWKALMAFFGGFFC